MGSPMQHRPPVGKHLGERGAPRPSAPSAVVFRNSIYWSSVQENFLCTASWLWAQWLQKRYVDESSFNVQTDNHLILF